MAQNKIIRVSEKFNKEMEDIQKKRIENGFDEEKVSKPKVSDLIRKHKFWPKLKQDLINFSFSLEDESMGKRGQISIFSFFGIFLGFAYVRAMLVIGTIVINVNLALDQDIDIGQVNLKTINSQTFGVFTTSILNNADWWGIALIFGMVMGLFLSSYMLRNIFPRWGMILDIFIILATFIVSLYLRDTYRILVDALSTTSVTFLEDYLVKTSSFILNLPIWVVIIGVVMMVLFHSGIPRKREESFQRGGLLQAP
jgi:hypothetical protein